MAAIRRYVPRSSSQLLSHIFERPELVAAVRDLPPPMLCRLIDRIGVEDSGDLIALATTEQLSALLDQDLWRANESGFEEHFEPQRFALWLQVMAEAGDEFLVRRLCELPVDLLTLAVNRLVLVIDIDALRSFSTGARDELGQIEGALENAMAEEWEEFCLIARDLDAWEDVWNALLLLDRDHHERLCAILEQCCAMSLEYINGQGGLYDVLTSDEMLESDALAARDDRRGDQGYVALSDARAFLSLASDERQPLAQRDAITSGYFRALDTTHQHERAASLSAPLAKSRAGSGAQELLRLVAEIDSEMEPRRSGARLMTGLTHETPALLAPHTNDEKHPLMAALAALSSAEPKVHGERMQELAYLANVLISGGKHEGRKLRPVEALEAAVATSNLGLELWQIPEVPRSLDHNMRLITNVGCDRMFRLGWTSLQRDIVQVANNTLVRRCMRLDARRARRAKQLIDDQNPHGLYTVCQAAQLGLDDQSFALLLALAEPLPGHLQQSTSAKSSQTSLWIASLSEFASARRRLAELAAGERGTV